MEKSCGNIFIRVNKGERGKVVEGHKHNFDHTTIFHVGSFHVKATLPNGTVIERDFVAPSHCMIRADGLHEITFTEDGEFWCVYSHRNAQGEVVQEDNGWGAAYV